MPRSPLLLLVLCWAGPAWSADPLPGHSSHGEVFNEGPRQAARLLPGMGRIEFPVTTSRPEAQAFFAQGVAQLHGFWYFEAERSFRQVAFLDPGCAMAYWGLAMANVNNEARAKGLLSKATERKESASPREKLWIASLENFYREDKRDKKSRALDFIKDLETIVQDHPEDVEAKAFLAWKIWHAKGDAPISSRQAVDALLDQVFAARPDHPAHHYRIHLWDDSKPARALQSAARCGQTAPGIAHLWHMPGHTYSKVRRFDDAAWQQEASARVDHAHLMAHFLLPDQIHNYAHNQEWLVRTFNELGRAGDALALASNLIEIPRHPKWNHLEKRSSSASFGRTRFLETLEKWEKWEDLEAAADSPWIHPVEQTEHEVTRLRVLGGARFELGHTVRLAETIRRLEDLKEPEAASKPDGKAEETGKAEADGKAAEGGKAEADGKTAEADGTTAGTDGKKPEPKKPTARENALLGLRALQGVLEGAADAAERLEAAKDQVAPARLARCWLRLGDPAKAAATAAKLPQDLAGLAAKTDLLLACGKESEAKEAFLAVRKLAFALDGDLPVARRLAEYAARFDPSGAWPPPAPVRTDSGDRPPLDSLGPVHWAPPVAPAWQASGLDGKLVSGENLKGQPVVLLFYLGSGCSHCVDQLKAFGKLAPDYAAAGLRLQAVSTESPGEAVRLKDLVPGPTAGETPFPVACDPGHAAFRAFRAYDDFEDDPLHATVLLDAGGRIRWIDVGWAPFLEADFVLAEAKRLLALPR